MNDWRIFILEHGRQTRDEWLARVLDQSIGAIRRVKAAGGLKRLPKRLDFGELYVLWHGRPATDDQWPAPRKIGGGYEWLAPEKALLARLVGTTGPEEICRVLTLRLRRVTGDPAAARTRNMIQAGLQKLGLQVKDVVGGVTVQEAAREIETRAILDHEIRKGRLKTMKIGRYVVIPHDEFARWKATRIHPPKGFVRLREVQATLGIRSDKLSEYARMGYVPTAVCCNTYASGGASTRWGTWWMDPAAARKLIADRRAGRPMPWHGKPEMGNLKVTYRLWQQRKHPARCATCRQIWGGAGAPESFDDYAERYPPLAHGAKRHLTRPYSDGLTHEQVAAQAGVSVTIVQLAVGNGVLRATRVGRTGYITQTDATRWIGRRRTTGSGVKSWLSVESACRFYQFTRDELDGHIASGRLRLRVGAENGTHMHTRYVLKQQVRELRDAIGFSEAEAARRVGVSIARLRTLLRGVNWRGAERIPFDTVHACIKRKNSESGVTVAEAARILGKPRTWVQNEINAGTVRPLRTSWDKHRLYITEPMFRRLCEVALHPRERTRWTSEWVYVSAASVIAGVSVNTLQLWAAAGDIKARPSPSGTRYHRRSLMARARRYWREEVRFKRAEPPAWLKDAAA